MAKPEYTIRVLDSLTCLRQRANTSITACEQRLIFFNNTLAHDGVEVQRSESFDKIVGVRSPATSTRTAIDNHYRLLRRFQCCHDGRQGVVIFSAGDSVILIGVAFSEETGTIVLTTSSVMPILTGIREMIQHKGFSFKDLLSRLRVKHHGCHKHKRNFHFQEILLIWTYHSKPDRFPRWHSPDSSKSSLHKITPKKFERNGYTEH